MKCLALGPGVMSAFAILGSIKRLADDEKLVDLEEISGSSAGSLCGFVYIASGNNINNAIKTVFKLDVAQLSKPNLISLIRDYGIIPKEKVISIFSTALKHLTNKSDVTFKELYELNPIKFHVASYCLDLKKTVYFSVYTDPEMSVLDALYMSVSIPVVFAMSKYKNQTFIDGALLEFTPCGPFIGKDTLAICVKPGEQRETTSFKNYIFMIFDAINSNRFKYSHVPHINLNLDSFDIYNFSMKLDEKIRLYVHGYFLC